MKYKKFQNIGILIVALAFLTFGFVGAIGNAQTRTRGKTAPTPKKKATPTPKRAKAKSTPTPKKNAKATSKKTTAKTKPTPKKNAKTTAKTASKTDRNKKSNDRNSRSKTTKDTKSNSKKPTTASNKNSKTPTRNSKTTKPVKTKTATVKPNPTPKRTTPVAIKTDGSQIIVSSYSASLRSSPSSTAKELSRAKLGTVYSVVEKRSGWYRVQLANQQTAWLPTTAAVGADKNGNDEVYKQLLAKNTATNRTSFAESVELYEFLSRAQPEIKDPNTAAEFGLKRLVALRSALKAIPPGQSSQKVYADFLKAQDENIVYSDPSAEWYVRAPLFWELHTKYTSTTTGERIAWEGAKNPLPGECEGYVNCHIFLLRMTDGEYLNYYPNASHSVEALRNITNFLEPIAADAEAKKVYNGPTDVSDRAEFNSLITELRVIISRLPNTEKEKALQQLKKIAEGFK